MNKKSEIPTEKVFVYIIFALQLPFMVLLTAWAYGNFQGSTATIPEKLPEFLAMQHDAMNCFTYKDPFTGQFQPFTYNYADINNQSFEKCHPLTAEIPRTQITFKTGTEIIVVTSPGFIKNRFAERTAYFESIPKHIYKEGTFQKTTMEFEVQV